MDVEYTQTGQRQANLVLIAYAGSEGSGEPARPLLAHTSSESRGTFRQKARSLAPLNGCACAVKICHNGMLEDTNSLDGGSVELGASFCEFINEPHHAKMCLRTFSTRYDSNRSAQLQRLARVLKFQI